MDRVGARLSELTIPDMQDLTDIPAALTLYMDGLRSHDIEKIGASFADEIHFITPARTMARGEILAFLGRSVYYYKTMLGFCSVLTLENNH